MSVLTIVQTACQRIGLNSPVTAVGSADLGVVQLVALLNEEGAYLAERHPWSALISESTFSTTATEDQGAIATLAGTGFSYVLNETMWNRTQRRPVFGPKPSHQWQNLKASFMNGPWIQYRIRGNRLLFLPAPAAGQSIYFEWVSSYYATDSGGTVKAAFTQDSDLARLPEETLTLGLIWRWKAAKGLDYADAFAKYEQRVADEMARDETKPRLNLAGGTTDVFPATVVPAGNWMQ